MKDFKFKNSGFFSKPIKRTQNSSKLIFISSLFVLTGFFSLNLFHLFSTKNKSQTVVQKSLADLQFSHVFPLLVNLKGQKGPQLAKVYVHISTEDENQKNLLRQNKKLEKQLLFLLSGQPVKSLKQEYFYSQIQSQLNAFLSGNLINQIHIKTEMLN